MKNFSSKIGGALVLSSLVLLPGCWLKDKLGLSKGQVGVSEPVKEGDMVLAAINGKPVLYKSEFDTLLKNLLETNPHFANFEGLEEKFLEGVAVQKLINYDIEKEGINKTPEYQQQLDALKQSLNAHFFKMKHAPKVTDTEMKAYFEKNKENMPEAIVSRGGVNATAVSFTNEADAKAFLPKAQGKGAQLEQVAKDAKLADKYRDLKLVNIGSFGVDPVLREKILAIKKFRHLN